MGNNGKTNASKNQTGFICCTHQAWCLNWASHARSVSPVFPSQPPTPLHPLPRIHAEFPSNELE